MVSELSWDMTEIIGGRHAVYHAVKAKARKVRRIWVSHSVRRSALDELLRAAESQGIPVATADKAFFAGHVPLETHQGVAAEVEAKPWTDLDDLLVPAAQPQRRLILLDGIEDPQNLGAILRSALCLGADAVIWPRRKSAPLSAVAVKAAAGAVEYLPLCRVNNLSQAIEMLKEASFWVYGASATGEQGIWDLQASPRSALVIGGEGKGLGHLVRTKCDALVSVPMVGPLKALNASVAGGILMAHFCRPQKSDD